MQYHRVLTRVNWVMLAFPLLSQRSVTSKMPTGEIYRLIVGKNSFVFSFLKVLGTNIDEELW